MLIFDLVPGLVAQRESVRLTRGRSLVRSQSGPPTVYLRQYPYARTVLSSWIFLGVRFLSGRESTVVVHSVKVGGDCVQLRVVKVAVEVGVWPQTVGVWRRRFVERRLGGLADRTAPRCSARDRRRADRGGGGGHAGAPAPGRDALVANVDGRKESGLSKSTVGRIWKAFGLKPHLVDTFKISNDPQFIDKVRDVVGLYLDPPEKALVLCVDEKSQIQALDRSAPVLPMMPGLPERRTHDYLRHGITTLFAALDVATGQIYGSIHRRHRAAEFKKFLTKLDSQIPADLDVHLICDNYATHKAPAVATWLKAHPRFHMHLTPRPTPPGSTRSSGGSPCWPTRNFAAAPHPIRPWRRTFATGSPTGTTTRNPSPGPRPPTKSSNASTHIFNEFLAQDTSEASPLTAERGGWSGGRVAVRLWRWLRR